MILRITKCGRRKKRDGCFPPNVLYLSSRIKSFIQFCKENSLDWAIVSAKHGLFFPDEKHSYYNTTFKTVNKRCRYIVDDKLLEEIKSNTMFQALVEQVRTQAQERGVESTLFLESSKEPWRGKCYLLLLHMALDFCDIHHETFTQLMSHIESLGDKGRVKLVTSFEELIIGELKNGKSLS